MNPIQRQARVAGLLYLLMALSAPFGLLIVPAEIFVPGDAVATADKIRQSPTLLRWGIFSELVHQTIAVFLVLALHRLFKPVSDGLAKQLVVLGALVSVPIVFVNVLNEVAALLLVSGDGWLSAFTKPQLDALAYLFVRLHQHGVTLASVFWGLWLFPFGLLVWRCGFIPRWLGVLLLLAGAGYVFSAFFTLVLPQHQVLAAQLAAPLQYCELPIILWLLIWGARPASAAQAKT